MNLKHLEFVTVLTYIKHIRNLEITNVKICDILRYLQGQIQVEDL